MDAILGTDKQISEADWEKAWEMVGERHGVRRVSGTRRTAIYRNTVNSEVVYLEKIDDDLRILIVWTVEKLVLFGNAVPYDKVWERVGKVLGRAPTGRTVGGIMSILKTRGNVVKSGKMLVAGITGPDLVNWKAEYDRQEAARGAHKTAGLAEPSLEPKPVVEAKTATAVEPAPAAEPKPVVEPKTVPLPEALKPQITGINVIVEVAKEVTFDKVPMEIRAETQDGGMIILRVKTVTIEFLK
ncbi:hypothetical protein A2619_00435 [candidate division WWE3 bacterium RIFOXYD1_FULL_39_9]|nr:MAG: hypothetical protein A2619_00435 [candidate division WWE3 bacterium RIFOXYD1_FULL_39_9]